MSVQGQVNERRFVKTENSVRFHFEAQEFSIHSSGSQDAIKRVLHLNSDYQLEPINQIQDHLGQTHIRWQVKYRSVPVLGSIIIGHFESGWLLSFNGSLFHPQSADPTISAAEATELGLKAVPEVLPAWSHPDTYGLFEYSTAQHEATLSYCPKDLNFNLKPQLCYSVHLFSAEQAIHKRVFIHANTGQLWV
jgi:Zn-dependent metalloprotease